MKFLEFTQKFQSRIDQIENVEIKETLEEVLIKQLQGGMVIFLQGEINQMKQALKTLKGFQGPKALEPDQPASAN